MKQLLKNNNNISEIRSLPASDGVEIDQKEPAKIFTQGTIATAIATERPADQEAHYVDLERRMQAAQARCAG